MSVLALVLVLGIIIALFWIFPNMPDVLRKCLYVVAVVSVVVWLLYVFDVIPGRTRVVEPGIRTTI